MSYYLIQLMIIMTIILMEMKLIMKTMQTFSIGVRIVENGTIMIQLQMKLAQLHELWHGLLPILAKLLLFIGVSLE